MAERKLAKGWIRVWWRVNNESPSQPCLLSFDVNARILDIWPEYKAPPECFAPEPKPVVVDDVVVVMREASHAYGQTRLVTWVYHDGNVSVGDAVLKPHDVERLGHMVRDE